MKTLLVLRHAKSSWKNPGQSDHERPLNKRGLAAAPRMGQLLAEQQLIPEIILCSTAERARQTAALAELHLDIPEWRKLGIRTKAKLNNYWIPKELDDNL